MDFKFRYDDENDVLVIYNSVRDVEESVQVSEDVVLDFDKKDKVNGVEVFYASEFFSALDGSINKDFLKDLENASFEYKEFRNQWFIVVMLQSRKKKIYQPMPLLRKSEYMNPLIAEQ